MRKVIGVLRRFMGRRDVEDALRSEEAQLEAACAVAPVDPRFAREMTTSAQRGDRIVLGRAARMPTLPVSLPISTLSGDGHTLICGASGSGKSRLTAGICRSLLTRIAMGERRGLGVIDEKSELVRDLLMPMVLKLLTELPPAAAQRLADSIVVLNPFATHALMPMNVLGRIPGVAPEIQAHDVASLLERAAGADFGVRQDQFVHAVLLLGILTDLTLVDIAHLVDEPTALAARAAACPSREVRSFFSTERISRTALEGVRARLSYVLRLPAARLMLGSRRPSPSLSEILREKILFVDLGSPPLGAESVQRFFSGLVTQRITQAIFERGTRDLARPLTLAMDEFQEGLSASGDAADQLQRLLSLARSRAVSLLLATQSLALAARAAPTLPRVLATNVAVQALFRASREDAETMQRILPITGRRPREAPRPWEPPHRTPFLSASEEREALIAEVTALPRRHFFLWDRNIGPAAELVVADAVDVPTIPFAREAVRRRVADGVLAVPVRELEGELARREAELVPAEAPAIATAPQLRPRAPRRRRTT